MNKLKKISPGVFLIIIFQIILSDYTRAQSPQEIARNAFQSTVLLVMEDNRGQPLSLGSGFFVSDGLIASNFHVVEGSSRGYAKLVGVDTKFNIEGITAIDRDRDLVLLKVNSQQPKVLSIGNSDNVQTGEPIYAVGNPQGLEGTFSQGIISSIRDIGTDKILQITAPISPGSSGGPVLNLKGEVIGVSVATFRGGQNLNFAIPSNYLERLISKSDIPISLADISSEGSQQSILSDLGGSSSEGVIGEQFSWQYEFTSGAYSITLRNQLRESVKNVHFLIIFYDTNDNPLDVDIVNFDDIIPGGLARRFTGRVDNSVYTLTTSRGNRRPDTRVEVRVLDFEIAD